MKATTSVKRKGRLRKNKTVDNSQFATTPSTNNPVTDATNKTWAIGNSVGMICNEEEAIIGTLRRSL